MRGMDGGKFKRRLSEINARALSTGQNELVYKFKMAAGDMVSIWEHVMEYTYKGVIGIKRKLVRSDNLLLNFSPSIPVTNPWWHLSKTLVMPSLTCAHIHLILFPCVCSVPVHRDLFNFW